MEKLVKDVNCCKNKHPVSIGLGSNEVEGAVNGDDDSETHLLSPPQRGGMSRKSEISTRKVKWNDSNGDKLAEVLEFEPSDVSDSEEEDSDSCICRIM